MNFLKSFNISTSALSAQRLRMDVIAQNIANANTTRTPNGGPYRRRVALLSPVEQPVPFASYLSEGAGLSGGGVKVVGIVEDNTPFKIVHDPSHPDADGNGDVRMPNVDTLQEMIDMMSATRAYEANITVLNAFKGMAAKALEIGR